MNKINETLFNFFILVCMVAQSIFAIEIPSSTAADVEQAVLNLPQQQSAGQGNLVQLARLAGNTLAVPVLKKHIRDSDFYIKHGVLVTLRIIKAPCANVESEVTSVLNDQQWLIRHDAVSYLASLECRAAKEDLRALFSKEEDLQVKEVVINAIGSLGEPTDIPLLEQEQKDSTKPMTYRLAATIGLLKLNGEYVASLIRDGIKNSDKIVQIKSLMAASLTRDELLKQEIEALKFSSELQSYVKIAESGIELNQIVAQTSKIDKLFSLIGEDIDLTKWAVEKILREFGTQNNVQVLISIGKGTQQKQADTNGFGQQQFDKKGAIVMSVLREKQVISEQEYMQYVRGQVE